MSYHGYIGIMKAVLSHNNGIPQILEIGVDKGVTFLSLANWLARFKENFALVGVDVKVREEVVIMVQNIDRVQERQVVDLLEINSLDLLPRIVEAGHKFDLVLIDGDHNYHTVSKELSYLNAITHQNSVVIIDDVSGRWSEKDLFYSERDEYVNCELATKHVETEKHGVKAAVDEFLEANPDWKSHTPVKGEPLLITRMDIRFEQNAPSETLSP